MAASFVPAHQDNLRATVDERLWFAGEASSFKYYGAERYFRLSFPDDTESNSVFRLFAWRVL